jgi:hypothetical protein
MNTNYASNTNPFVTLSNNTPTRRPLPNLPVANNNSRRNPTGRSYLKCNEETGFLNLNVFDVM